MKDLAFESKTTRKDSRGSGGSDDGETAYNNDTKAIDIYTNGSVGMTAHELKHGFQFETGQISYLKGGAAGNLGDINDEVDAYKRQYLFDPNSLPVKAITPAHIRGIVNSKGKQPYLNLPSANLTSNSTVEQVFNAVKGGAPDPKTANMSYGHYVNFYSLPEVVRTKK